jgi:hypothetical protein
MCGEYRARTEQRSEHVVIRFSKVADEAEKATLLAELCDTNQYDTDVVWKDCLVGEARGVARWSMKIWV